MNDIQNVQLNNGDKAKEPIRILHCVAGIGRGGYETLIMNIYRKIDRSKVQFDFLYSFGGVYRKEILELGGRVYKIPFITEKGPFTYTKYVRDFFRSHPEYKIVHSHMDKFSGHIMRIAKQEGVPVRIAHSHAVASEGMILYRIVKNYYGMFIDPNCTHRMACSAEAARWLFKDKADKAVIVKNGIDLDNFNNEDTRTNGDFTIASVGRLEVQKNHKFLLEVFGEVKKQKPNAKLILAGTGSLQAELENQAEQLQLSDSVEFAGDCDDVYNLLHKSDVMCLPSLSEGLGIVFIEAQACGVKCVASDRVPVEAKVSDDIIFLPLEKGAKYWADEILKIDVREKKNNHERIRNCGYDINEVARKIEKFYIDRYTENSACEEQ